MSGAKSSLKKFVHWLLLAVAALIILTRFGIVEYQLVTAGTLDLLNKDISLQMHINLWQVFLILLVLHVYLSAKMRPD